MLAAARLALGALRVIGRVVSNESDMLNCNLPEC